MNSMKGIRVGFALTGSFCTFAQTLPIISSLKESGADVTAIMSEYAYATNTRFGTAEYWQKEIETITEKSIIHSVLQAEPIGPKALLDILIVAPCTGNTLAKLAHGITDSSVTMACKAHLRNNRPLVLAISTNDGLATAATNIGSLQVRKNIYFVPYGQDDALGKPFSLVAYMDKLIETTISALNGVQLQPLVLEKK